jgi:hypothetical protein
MIRHPVQNVACDCCHHQRHRDEERHEDKALRYYILLVHRLRPVARPTVWPRLLRNVVVLPLVVAVPVVWPLSLRKVVVLPFVVAVPVVWPRLLRKVVWFWAAAGAVTARPSAAAISKRVILLVPVVALRDALLNAEQSDRIGEE